MKKNCGWKSWFSKESVFIEPVWREDAGGEWLVSIFTL